MTTPTDQPDELPVDAAEADYVEQHQPAVPGDEDPDELVPPAVDTDVEADPADVLEQATPVPLGDDEVELVEDDERA